MKKITESRKNEVLRALDAAGIRSASVRRYTEPDGLTMFAVTLSNHDAATGNFAVAEIPSVDEIPAAIKKVNAALYRAKRETLELMAAERRVDAE